MQAIAIFPEILPENLEEFKSVAAKMLIDVQENEARRKFKFNASPNIVIILNSNQKLE